MGRIKTTLIKRTGDSVVKNHSEELTINYDSNKVMVTKFVELQSKKLRNIIAGHVTREMRKKQDQ